MKLAFVVHNEWLAPQVMQLLKDCGIDYYTRWHNVQGKGRGTEPHLGTGSYGSTNMVMMIAFEEEAPLEALTAFATPKSLTTAWPSESSTLSGLMSRCTTPFRWA